MRKTVLAVVPAMAFAMLVTGPANAAEPTASIDGSVGERVTDGSSLRLRYVGDPAPAGYTGNYQRGASVVTPSPESTPVSLVGTLDLSGMTENGQTAVIGLHDKDALANGQTGHKQEAGIYVTYRTGSDGYYDIGVTDGDAGGGEWVQAFERIPVADLSDGIVEVEFVVNGAADPATCASHPADVATADGCMTLTINDEFTVSDSYGTISPAGATVELGDGAHPGWYAAWTTTGPEIGVLYDLTITPAVSAPQSKDDCKKGGYADYGFSNQGRCIASLVANGGHGR